MVSSIRVALLPLAVTLVSSTITYLSGLVTQYPATAIIINVAVLALTYADSYLTALEKESVTTTTVTTPTPTGSTSVTTTGSNPSPFAPTPTLSIAVTPSAFKIASGASLTITGKGATPNGKVNITADDDQLGVVVADAKGNFTLSAAYSITQSAVSNLANAVQDAQEAGDSYITVSAYDYGTDEASNDVDVQFS